MAAHTDTSPHTEEWSTSRSLNGTTSAFSLFRRHRSRSQNGDNATSGAKYSYGDGHGSTKEDRDDDDSSSFASASSAAAASITTQTTNTTAQTAPPAYDALYAPASGAVSSSSPDKFHPTLHLQIDAVGRGACMTSALFTPGQEATSVYVVDEHAAAASAANSTQGSTSPQTSYYNSAPAFISLRKSRGSSSCSLVAGAGYSLLRDNGAASASQSDNAAAAGTLRTVSTTTYRFGPGRPPRIDVGGDLSATSSSDTPSPWDSFEVKNKAIWSRRQQIQTRLGTFEWRYASSAERKDLSKELLWQVGAGKEDNAMLTALDKKEKKRKEKEEKAMRKHHDVKSLLVLDHITQVYGSTDTAGPSSSSSGGPREIRRPVARFIRNAELRTPGSSRNSAGNGGRLQIDLREWEAVEKLALGEKKLASDGISDDHDREMMITMTVSSALCMLKKEIDRRQGQEAAAIASAVS